jgi:hypothetical protein
MASTGKDANTRMIRDSGWHDVENPAMPVVSSAFILPMPPPVLGNRRRMWHGRSDFGVMIVALPRRVERLLVIVESLAIFGLVNAAQHEAMQNSGPSNFRF